MNALIVHGTRSDRAMVENLLEILDSSNVPDSLGADRPQIIPVEFAEASTVADVLRAVYKTQLSTGGNRPQVDIPEGVSSDVASVLQQINAATSGPLLTLEVDELTNSIVVLAPLQLRQQVAELIGELDQNARDSATKAINIISLRHANADRIGKALDVLLQGQN